MTLPVFDTAAIEQAAAANLVFDTVREALIAHAMARPTVATLAVFVQAEGTVLTEQRRQRHLTRNPRPAQNR